MSKESAGTRNEERAGDLITRSPFLVPHNEIRLQIEQHELEYLSRFAAKAAESAGRVREEEQDSIRTCFQRDRDRILHCKSFRRLKHKTQVFIDPSGDHYRTRLTHTLEVSQIARTISRALRLNEDLTEAIALGHDVGHTPFGHAGEAALDEAVRELAKHDPHAPKGFKHYEQSLRVLDVLENLNLTEETRAGVGGHSKGRKDLSSADGEPVSTLEAAVVRVSDRIAYLNHDLDDAERSGMIKEPPAQFRKIGATFSKRIAAMVQDVIFNSLDQPAIHFSEPMMHTLNQLKEWLFENVYLKYPTVLPDSVKAQGVVRELFCHYCEQDHLPEGFSGVQGAIDYVAGMTDRFAIEKYEELRVPNRFRR